MSILSDLREIQDKSYVYTIDGVLHWESIIEKKYPDVDVELLLDVVSAHLDLGYLDDDFTGWEGVIEEYADCKRARAAEQGTTPKDG